MKKRNLRNWSCRCVSILLSVLLAIEILPTELLAYAGGTGQDLKSYSYQRMESLAGNGRTIAVHYDEYRQYALFSPMVQGETTVIQYTLPSNGLMKVSVYDLAKELPEYKEKYDSRQLLPTESEFQAMKTDGSLEGLVVGAVYNEHYEVTTSGSGIKVNLLESDYQVIKNKIKQLKRDKKLEFEKLYGIAGIGLDGKGAKWNSLSGYYRANGLPNPYEIPDPVPRYKSVQEAETVSQNTVSQNTVSENTTVSGCETAEEIPDKIPDKASQKSGEFTNVNREWTDLLDIEEGDMSIHDIPKEEIPEDYFITRNPWESFAEREVSTYSLQAKSGNAQEEQELFHNYICFKGQYFNEDTGKAEYLKPGFYLIAFEYWDNSPLQGYQNTRFLPVQIIASGSGQGGTGGEGGTGGDSGDISEPSVSDILDALRKYDMVPAAATGYPTLADVNCADPVNLLTGALLWDYTDLQLQGKMPLTFSRSYNSVGTGLPDCGLGAGWSHNYAYHAEVFYSDAFITLPSGGIIPYKLDAGGSYQPVTGGNEYRFVNTGNGYLLYNESGLAVVFDTAGNAVTIRDAQGSQISLEYTENRLTAVSNGANQIRFTWQGDSLIKAEDGSTRTVCYEYQDGNLVKAVNADGDCLEYTYDANHNLLTVRDFSGTVIMKNTYDEKHRILTQTMEGRGQDTFSYQDNERKNTYEGSGGVKTTITYDENFRITAEENNDGSVIYEYDELNRRIRETDRNGGVYNYTYDGATSNIVCAAYPDGTKELFTYNEKGYLTGYTDGAGGVCTYEYDGSGNLLRETGANQGTTTYTYDTNGYRTSMTDALGNTTSYKTDGSGNITEKTDALGNTTKYRYDASGRLLEEITPMGRKYAYTYSPSGKLLSETYPDGTVKTYTYNQNGCVLQETDFAGNVTEYTYNALNQLLTETDPSGAVKAYTYDEQGNRITETDGDGNAVSYTYDVMGRVTAVIRGGGGRTDYAYDGNGNLISETDALGGTCTYQYDACGRLLQETDENGGITKYAYDGAGRLLQITDAQGSKVSYTYDKDGNQTSRTDANGNRTDYEYNLTGCLIGTTNALGEHTAFVYDKTGRLIKAAETEAVYDADGLMTAMTDAAGNTTSYAYDKNARLIEETNPAGGKLSYTYDANGNLLSETDTMGNQTSYIYDAVNRVVSTEDAMGNVTAYEYSKAGKPLSKTDALGGVTLYAYDAAGNIAAETLPGGVQRKYAYDDLNRLVEATDENAGQTAYAYDKAGNLITVRHPDGGCEEFTYDSLNRRIASVDQEGYRTVYEYDANGNQVAVTDGNKNTVRRLYDALNRLAKSVNPEGGEVSYEYDRFGRTVRVLAEDGTCTSYEYDSVGNMTAVTDGLGNKTAYAYDTLGNRLSEITPGGALRTYIYDEAGRLIQQTDSLSSSVFYTYDSNGNLTKYTDEKGNTTKYSYDALNRLISITDSLEHTENYQYDKAGNLVCVTDKNGNKTIYLPDGKGNTTEVIDGAGHSAYFTYDACDRLSEMRLYSGEERTAQGGRVLTGEQITRYEYDKRGLLVKEINAKGDEIRYTYDAAGNQISKTDEDGYVTAYRYDCCNRIAEIDYNGAKTVSYGYDSTGELTEMQDWNGTTSITRDALGRILTVTDHKGRVTGYEWDASDNLTAFTYPDGTGAAYTYDSENRQLAQTDEDGQSFTFSYDKAGNLTSKRWGNGEMERYQYDSENRLIRMDEYTMTGVQKTYTTYTYDAAGSRTSECSRVPSVPVKNWEPASNTGTWGGVYKTYTYDPLGHLVKEKEQDTSKTVTYTYDFLGNRITQKDNRDSLTYTYNELNQIISKKGYNGLTYYTYDKRGNRIGETTQYGQENRRTYEWDETNHLVKGTRGPDYGLYTSEYTYNGLGIRIGSAIMGPEKTRYERDYVVDYTGTEHNDLMEYTTVYSQWQWPSGAKAHELKHLYTVDGARLETQVSRYSTWSSEVTRYKLNVHEDIMGSAVYYTRQDNGYTVNKHSYDVWGYNSKSPTYNYDPEYRETEPYFTGHPFDGSLNIYFAEARFYDAQTGAWLSKDPAKDGLNWYAYCENSPVSKTDPTGEIAIPIGLGLEALGEILLSLGAAYLGYELVSQAIGVNTAMPETWFEDLADTNTAIGGRTKVKSEFAAVTCEGALEGTVEAKAKAKTKQKAGEKEGNSDAGTIAAGLGAIAGQYSIFKCKEAADAMAKYLRKQSQEFKFITMYYPNSDIIISLSREAIYGFDSEASQISVNGYHYGIEYKGIVYCNVHPFGLPRKAWEADFWGADQASRTITPP